MKCDLPHVLACALALTLPIFAGCGAMSPTERAWQTLHLVDVAQTLKGPASDPCFREATMTRHLIGEQPDPAAVIAWGIAAGTLHYLADQWLQDAELPGGIEFALRSIDLGYKGFTVGSNYAAGVRLVGANECPWR